MTQLIPSDDSPTTRFAVPLPVDPSSPELFGFWTYELRVGHTNKVWSTAQGRFGSPLVVNGLQHPPPPLTVREYYIWSATNIMYPFSTILFALVSSVPANFLIFRSRSKTQQRASHALRHMPYPRSGARWFPFLLQQQVCGSCFTSKQHKSTPRTPETFSSFPQSKGSSPARTLTAEFGNFFQMGGPALPSSLRTFPSGLTSLDLTAMQD